MKKLIAGLVLLSSFNAYCMDDQKKPQKTLGQEIDELRALITAGQKDVKSWENAPYSELSEGGKKAYAQAQATVSALKTQLETLKGRL